MCANIGYSPKSSAQIWQTSRLNTPPPPGLVRHIVNILNDNVVLGAGGGRERGRGGQPF